MGFGSSIATIFVDIEGDLTKFRKAVKEAGNIAGRELGGGMSRAGKRAGTALATGAATALAGGATAFIDFERGMNEIFTLLPGESQATFDQITDQTKDFAAEFGVLPDQVIGGLYDALGAGVPRDNVFTFLETANEFAKAGNVDLTTSVDALTTGVNAFGLGAGGATRVADSMTKAVLLGKTTTEELAGSLYNVAPVAAAFGVQVEDIAAGFAVLTAQGTPTAQAATQMKAAIAELGKDGTKAADAFGAATGKTFTEYIEGGGNLVEASGLMAAAAEAQGVSMIDLFGSIEGGQAFLGLASDMDVSLGYLEQIEDGAGSTEAAFEQMEKGIGPSLDKTKARLSVTAIELGTALAPALETAGIFAAEFGSFLAKLPGPVLAVGIGVLGLTGGLMALSGPILRTAQLVKGLFTVLSANPYLILIAATIAVGILIYKNWDEISAWLSAKWEAIKGVTANVWGSIRDFFSGTLSAIGGFFDQYVISPVEWIVDLFASLPEKAAAAWNGVSTAVANVKDAILGALRELREAADRALGPIDEILGKAGSFGGGVIGGAAKIFGFDDGGVVPGPRGAPRLVLAHAGETILPTHKEDGFGGGGMVVQGPLIGSATISSELDIEHVARELGRRLDREKRAQGRLKA